MAPWKQPSPCSGSPSSPWLRRCCPRSCPEGWSPNRAAARVGVLIGPHALGSDDEAIDAFRELGLGMLFLFAGYEIEPKELTSHGGRRALVTWLCHSSALGFVVLLACRA